MDNNYDEYDEDNIRPPDSVKKEKLIDDTFVNTNNINPSANTEYYLNTIIEMSKNEFDSIQEQEEQKTIESICNEMKEQHKKERLNKFDNVKMKLNQILLFDRQNTAYYELVLSIIEMYETNVIHVYNTNLEEHSHIFNILKTIRLPINEIDNLKKIILYE